MYDCLCAYGQKVWWAILDFLTKIIWPFDAFALILPLEIKF